MSGSDFLNLSVDAVPARGRTSWLTDRIRDAVSEGALPPATRLPASRILAEDLGISRGTVVEAYRRLGEEGLLSTNRGGGTLVAATPARMSPATTADAAPPRTDEPLDISAGVPDLTAFPRAAWLRAERRALATATERQLGYADPQGLPELRSALANWLARSRGLSVSPEQVIVTSGVTGAVALLAPVLQAHGIDAWAIEDPGANGNRRILDYWTDDPIPVPVDEDGPIVEALSATSARVALVTPAHQFPTGVVLAPARRRELAAWADAVDGYVVEDDYDSEYRYDRTPVRAMHPLAPERIVHISSLSKVLAPALRLGWMIAPSALHRDLVRRRWATDLGSPALPQLALADLIDSGALERHLRGLRLRHRERRDAAVEAIRHALPGCRIEGIAAGLHVLVRLPDGLDDVRVAAAARREGILVTPLSTLRTVPGYPGLVIGYGPHSVPRMHGALRTLGRLAGLS